MATATEDKFRELLHDFGVAMLVTRTSEEQLRSRPMALADVEPNGTLWFCTQSDSGKVGEVASDNNVNVSMQSSWKFVSISGHVFPVDDRQKVAEFWKEPWKIWFPGGKDDPSLLLLKVEWESGEYWDNSGASGLKYLIEAGKAYVSGTRPDVGHDPNIHGCVRIS